VATPVRAAGGVLVRDGLIALVHRPGYNDWTLPKGKLNKGEHALVAACREVREETGVRPSARTRLPTVTYPVRTADGFVDKTVDYWSMVVDADLGFTPNHEIDEVAWLSEVDTLARLTYPHDVEVLSAHSALPPVTSVVTIVRHAHAGRRGSFVGPDSARPLNGPGGAETATLTPLLSCLGPTVLVSASPRRCVQTIGPIASILDLPIEVESVFDEDADPDAAVARIRELASQARSTVVCSQGVLIPTVMATLSTAAGRPGQAGDFTTAKATGWVLSFHGQEICAIDALNPFAPEG
jgi:8-oxo-(d)GTP phosphatase